MIENNLKYAREELEITQSELGNVLEVKKATISNWENGYDTIPLIKLIKFCNLYNYSIDYIVGLTRNNKKYSNKINITKELMSKKLKSLRTELHITQQQIADECGISRATYSHYEIGMNLISTITLYTICKNHKLSIDEFLRN